MSETRFHGARVTENTDLVTAINDVDSSVIGIVATADDADAKLFPLNKPTLLTRVNDVLGKCGTTGTLYRALKAIADQVSTKVIVVRVAEHKEEDGKTQDQLVIGGSEDDGSYTGMYALLVAEQDESIGYRPRILAAPELDTEAVTKSLCVIAGKLRAFVYASCHGCNTMAEAITYRQKFNEREVMLLWPDFIAYNPKSGKNETFPAPAYACGLRAYIDHEQGWHKSLSNVPVKNVLGMSRHVFWSLQAEDSDANSLNNKEITTIIRRNGFRFWGNRTATDSRRCVAGNDCNDWLVVTGYWGALREAGHPASWFRHSYPVNECCQSVACVMGNGDGVRFFTGRRYRGVVQSGRSYRGCACRSCRSHLEILGSHQGIFCRGVQRDYGKADPVARNL